MRDVNYGWLLRNMHASGASMFFIAVYIHMFRGLYYGSYKEPREVLWILGVIIYLLMMATGFMGYVLPWGQMSFWGATVITNLFSAIPYVGDSIVTLLWGGYSVGNPTLNRFFSLHYLLPFVIAGVVVLHIWALHVAGQNNPAGVEPKTEKDTVPFTPYATMKDAFGVSCFMLFFAWFIFYMPNYLGDAENYIPANPAVTPAHIVPEWYYLPFYAILRSIPNKLAGVVAMFGAILILAFLPWLDSARTKSSKYRPLAKQFFWIFVVVCIAARLARRQARGRHLCDRRPRADVLLLRLFPDCAAAAEPDREAEAGAEFDRRRRAGEDGKQVDADGVHRDRADGRGRAVRRVRAGRPCGRGTGNTAVAEMVVFRSGRQVRSRRLAARPEGLQGSMRVLPRPVLHRVPQSRRCRRPRLLDGAGGGVRIRLQGQGRSERRGRHVRTARPAGRLLPVAVPERQAARAANGGALPPDLSLITKARTYARGFPQFIFDFFTQFQEQGPNYVSALLLGYVEKPPADFKLPEGSSYNKYFPGHAIKMPNPLSDGQVTYDDGSPATAVQYSKDVTTFLMWTAEPHMEARKKLGLQVFVFLILLTGLLYFTKKKIWADAH